MSDLPDGFNLDADPTNQNGLPDGFNLEKPPEENKNLANFSGAGDLGEVTKGASFGLDKDLGAAIFAGYQAGQKGHLKDFTKDYSEGRQQLVDSEKSQEKDHPYRSFFEQVGGALPSAAIGTAGTAGSALGAIGRAAIQGAAQGAIQGFGDADEGKRASGAGYGGLTGAVVGGGLSALGKGAKGIYNSFLAPALDKDTVNELAAKGLNLTPGQLGGKAGTSVEGLSSQAPLSGIPLRQTYANQKKSLQSAVDDISGSSAPTPATSEEAGDELISGLRQSHRNFLNKKSALYNDAFKNIPDDTPIQTDETQAALNNIFSRYGGNESLQKLAGAKGGALGTLQDAIDEGSIGIGVAKKQLKGIVADAAKGAEGNKQNVLASDIWDVYHAIDKDILQTAHGVDPSSVNKIAQTDKFFSDRIQQSQDLRKLFDPNDPDKIKAANAYTKFLSFGAQGKTADSKTLQTVKDLLPGQEWDAVKQFHLSNLGQAKNGEFTNAQFIKDANKITPEAKNIYFDGDPQKLKAFDNLVKYAKATQFNSTNPSGTAGALGEGAIIGSGAFLHSPWLLGPSAANFLYGSLLSKPGAAALINQLPRNVSTVKTNPAAQAAVLSVFRALQDPKDSEGEKDQTQPHMADGGAVTAPQDNQFTPENLNKFVGTLQQFNAPTAPAPQEALLDKIQTAETGNNPNAVNPNSTASGPFQFTNPTWKSMVSKYGDTTGIGLKDKGDAKSQRTMAALMLKDNDSFLSGKIGRPPTDGELYAAHFLGAEGANKLIQNLGQNTPVTYLFPPSYIRANKQIFLQGTRPRTADEVYQILANKVKA